MRPRKTSFGTIPYSDIKKFFIENYVWGFTVYEDADFLTYTFHVMFRRNREDPEELYVKVSRRSKLIVHIASNKRKFLNITDVLDKVKLKQSYNYD